MLSALIPATVTASTIAYDSTGWWVKPANGNYQTWRYSTPSPAASIGWSMGSNVTANQTWPIKNEGAESKFNFVAGAIVAKTYTGFSDSNTGSIAPAAATTVTASGSGTSGPVGGTLWGTNYRASWSVKASVPLSAPKYSYAQAEADDPFPVTLSQLSSAGVSGLSLVDFFIPVAIDSASLSATGSGTIDVSYLSASGLTKLFGLTFSNGAVVAAPGSASGLSYYLETDTTVGPAQNGVAGLSTQALQSAILANLQSATPFAVGVLWQGAALPSVDLGNGSVAKFMIDTTVSESSVPEPATNALIGFGLLALSAGLQKRAGAAKRKENNESNRQAFSRQG